MWKRTSAVLGLVGLALATGTAGTLDPDFGIDGVVVAGNGDSGQLLGLALQADGKVVAVGQKLGPPDEWRIRRFNADGSADTSFDAAADTGLIGGVARRVVLDGSGRIVVAGTATIQKTGKGGKTTTVSVTAVVRVLADGSLDSTFGTSGKSLTEPGLGSITALALQPDGKILVGAGSSIRRLHANGAVDNGFGSSGTVTDDIRRNGTESLWSIAVQSTGNIVAAYQLGATNRDPAAYWALRRYTSSGSVDTSFGGSGLVTSPGDQIRDVAVDSLDRIVVAGAVLDAQGHWDAGLVVRYTSGGAMDTSFASGGEFIAEVSGSGLDAFLRLAVIDGDKVLVHGVYYPPTTVYIARLDADGDLDPAYGNGGFGDAVQSSAYAMAVDADGNAVAGARPDNSDEGDVTTWVIARWLGN